jgi:hypothetical protein
MGEIPDLRPESILGIMFGGGALCGIIVNKQLQT